LPLGRSLSLQGQLGPIEVLLLRQRLHDGLGLPPLTRRKFLCNMPQAHCESADALSNVQVSAEMLTTGWLYWWALYGASATAYAGTTRHRM